MDLKPRDYILACAGCALITTLGIFIGLAAQALGFPDLTTPIAWENLPGEHFKPLRISCKSPWSIDDDAQTLTCDELKTPPDAANNRPTTITVYKDHKTHKVSLLHFQVHSYTPQLTSDQRSSPRLLTWSETLTESFHLADCPQKFSPYPDTALWSCQDRAFAHTTITADSQGQPTAHFWIATDLSALASSFHNQAQEELRQRAKTHIKSAKALTETQASPQSAAADRHLIKAYLNLLLLPAQNRAQDDHQTLQSIPIARQKIRALAHSQRQSLQSSPPLPTLNKGIIHIPGLRHRPPHEMETLLSEGSCEETPPRLICRYGDRHWQAQILFKDLRSTQITLELHKTELPLNPNILPHLGLPPAQPDHQELHQLRWENLPGLRSLQITASPQKTEPPLTINLTFDDDDDGLF